MIVLKIIGIIGVLAYLIATIFILRYATHGKHHKPLLVTGWLFFTLMLAILTFRHFGLFH